MWEETYTAACEDTGVAVRENVRLSGASGALTVRGNDFGNFTHRLTDADVEAIVAALRVCPTVSAVCLPYNVITDQGGVLLAEALTQHTNALEEVDLQHNTLGPESGMALAAALAANDSLSSLRLAGNALGGQCGSAFGASLRRNSTLAVLDLYNTDMTVQSLVPLCRSLEVNRGLVALNIGRPLLRGPDEVASVVEHLAAGLKGNTTLMDLDVSYFGLTDGDLQSLVVALCASAVTSLSVKSNKLSEDAGQLLAALLERRHDFRLLDVSCNRMRDRGAHDLAKGLAQHPHLSSLSVASCTMGEPGLVALVSALRSCAALRQLTLWGNTITPAVAEAIAKGFGDLRKMDKLDFGVEQRDGEWVAFRS